MLAALVQPCDCTRAQPAQGLQCAQSWRRAWRRAPSLCSLLPLASHAEIPPRLIYAPAAGARPAPYTAVAVTPMLGLVAVCGAVGPVCALCLTVGVCESAARCAAVHILRCPSFFVRRPSRVTVDYPNYPRASRRRPRAVAPRAAWPRASGAGGRGESGVAVRGDMRAGPGVQGEMQIDYKIAISVDARGTFVLMTAQKHTTTRVLISITTGPRVASGPCHALTPLQHARCVWTMARHAAADG